MFSEGHEKGQNTDSPSVEPKRTISTDKNTHENFLFQNISK